MNYREIYNSGYGFANEENKKRIKRLKIVTFLFPLALVIVFLVGLISDLPVFKQKVETVQTSFPDTRKRDEEITLASKKEKLYNDANIPYSDPNGRFTIIFMTPFVSSDIAVVIKNKKDYYETKKEADGIIAKAREKVNITSVTYFDNFE